MEVTHRGKAPPAQGGAEPAAFAFLKYLQDNTGLLGTEINHPKLSIYSKTFHIKKQNKQTPPKDLISWLEWSILLITLYTFNNNSKRFYMAFIITKLVNYKFKIPIH